MENLKKLFEKKWMKAVLIAAIVIAALVLGGLLQSLFSGGEEGFVVTKPSIKTESLYSILEKSSELTAAKVTITGLSEYKDTGVKVWNRSDFTMVYKATVRAGIDISKVTIDVDNDNQVVTVTIPKAEILEATVDPSTIQYYDEKFSLFNTNSKTDANKAQALANEDAKKEALNVGILESADAQSEIIIRGLLADAVTGQGFALKINNKTTDKTTTVTTTTAKPTTTTKKAA